MLIIRAETLIPSADPKFEQKEMITVPLQQQFVREAAGLTDDQIGAANESLPEKVDGEVVLAVLEGDLSRFVALSLHKVNAMEDWSKDPAIKTPAQKVAFQRQTEILARWVWDEVEYAFPETARKEGPYAHSLRRGWKVVLPSK
ncbi:MAG: hypothetical protein WCV68_01065 [Candidatus Paceibacterota bacterium]|jgi:hypothetical protein